MSWAQDKVGRFASDLSGLRENVVGLRATRQAAAGGPAALDLVAQLAETIASVKKEATALEQRSQKLAEDAAAKSKDAEDRAARAEQARQAAERALEEALGCARAAEKECDRAKRRAAEVQSDLLTAKLSLSAAEARADQAEKALKRLEDAVRNELLGFAISDPFGRGAAA